MKEIKFRAWHKESQCILTVDFIDFNYKNDDGSIGLVAFIEPINEFDEDIDYACKLNEIELMQFTGIKDKNDKEIYEGDILSYSRDNQKKIDYVKWYAPCFILGEIIMGYCKDFEIIGNIYENPELFEEK